MKGSLKSNQSSLYTAVIPLEFCHSQGICYFENLLGLTCIPLELYPPCTSAFVLPQVRIQLSASCLHSYLYLYISLEKSFLFRKYDERIGCDRTTYF